MYNNSRVKTGNTTVYKYKSFQIRMPLKILSVSATKNNILVNPLIIC